MNSGTFLILQTFLRLVFENKILLIITGLGSNYIEATILRTCIVVEKTREMLCSSVKYPPKFLAVNLSLGRHISSLYIRGSKSGLSIPGAKERGERGSVVLDLGVSSASSTRTIKKKLGLEYQVAHAHEIGVRAGVHAPLCDLPLSSLLVLGLPARVTHLFLALAKCASRQEWEA